MIPALLVVAGSGGSATLRTQLSGGIPIGEIGYKSVLDASKEGIPVLAVGGGAQGPYGGDFYARADNNRVNDLRDIKKWAYTNPGSSIYARSFLLPKTAGLPTKAKRIAAPRPSASPPAESARVRPYWRRAASTSPGCRRPWRAAARASSRWSWRRASTSLTSSRASSPPARPTPKEHPDVVRGVLAGRQEAAQWITQNPDAAARIYAKHVDLPVPAAVSVVKGAVKSNVRNVGFNSAALKRATEAAVVSGFKGDVKYCDFIDTSYLPSGATAELPTKCGA
ncbi:hypothetical protein [Streptomyces rhizosphaericus]|uniref:hypothetical protein n=1 Tax=Streptomyces rhizosphaericus TaxID=114699 RepID=UPI00117F7E5F|nr:hypothetical protein [Streptomyces rhizosphaericus]